MILPELAYFCQNCPGSARISLVLPESRWFCQNWLASVRIALLLRESAWFSQKQGVSSLNRPDVYLLWLDSARIILILAESGQFKCASGWFCRNQGSSNKHQDVSRWFTANNVGFRPKISVIGWYQLTLPRKTLPRGNVGLHRGNARSAISV